MRIAQPSITTAGHMETSLQLGQQQQQQQQKGSQSSSEQVLAAAELLLERSRQAAVQSPWWQSTSSETIADQIESYRHAIRNVQYQLSTTQGLLPEQNPQPQHASTHQHSALALPIHKQMHHAESLEPASQHRAAAQITTQEAPAPLEHQECKPHGLSSHSTPTFPLSSAEQGVAVKLPGNASGNCDKGHVPLKASGSESSLGIADNADSDLKPDPDPTPDQSEPDQPIPPHSIPIHANVMTYDWGPLIQNCQFDVIMMDPPWQLATANPTRGVALGYSQLNDEAIASLPVPELQQNGFLFVWVINAKYKWTLDLFERWGYEMVDEVVWVKMTVNRRLAKSHGYYLQHAKEVCLVGKRGFDPPGTSPCGVASDIIFSERRGQSQKPTEIYDLIEALVPNGRYLEIFARRNNLRDYWVSIGNEVTGTGLPPEDLASIAENKRITGAVYGRGNS